jgi:hypothetical protein
LPKKTISYCVKYVAGHVHREGKIGSTRCELDAWVRTLPQPRMIAMEATIFTGWICDHLLPHASAVKVAHPLMLTIERCQTTEYAQVSSLERDPLLKERIRRLRTVPGVGPITALNWALEMGDISRFRSIKGKRPVQAALT